MLFLFPAWFIVCDRFCIFKHFFQLQITFHLSTQTPPQEFRCSLCLTWAALGICCHYWHLTYFPQLSRSIIVKTLESEVLRHQLTFLACLYVRQCSFQSVFLNFVWGFIFVQILGDTWQFFWRAQMGKKKKKKPWINRLRNLMNTELEGSVNLMRMKIVWIICAGQSSNLNFSSLDQYFKRWSPPSSKL